MADLKGEMQCKVTSNHIVTSKHGQPGNYTNFTDQFVVGDQIAFTYEMASEFNIGDKTYPPTMSFKIHDRFRDHEILYWFGAVKRTGIGIVFDREADTMPYRFGYQAIGFDQDSIWANVGSMGRINFSRYDEGKWEAIATRQKTISEGRAVQVFTLDCRNFADQVAAIMAQFPYEETLPPEPYKPPRCPDTRSYGPYGLESSDPRRPCGRPRSAAGNE